MIFKLFISKDLKPPQILFTLLTVWQGGLVMLMGETSTIIEVSERLINVGGWKID